jgi:hypothetical protein
VRTEAQFVSCAGQVVAMAMVGHTVATFATQSVALAGHCV